MSIGMIYNYDERKRWGYIRSKEGDIYFHQLNCVDGFQPELGAEVEYEKGKPFKVGKGPQAINVRPTQPRCGHTISSGEYHCELREGHPDNHFSRSADIFWKSEHSDGVQIGGAEGAR
jgi:cold shock CspA family protein